MQFLSRATYLFVIHCLKVARQRPHFLLSLPALSDADPMGSAKLLSTYLQLTCQFGGKSRHLLLSFVVPQPISVDTVSRWVRLVHQAGIDVKIFGAHSMRGASASLASSEAAPAEAILNASDWSALSSFHQHIFAGTLICLLVKLHLVIEVDELKC